MIEISAETAFLLYLAFACLSILFLWIRRKHKKKEITASYQSDKSSFTCELCYHTYLDDPLKPFTRCPECGVLNKNLV